MWPEDDNPFVAFRRFADEQISSMLQSVMGIPSMVSPPMRDHWAVFEDKNNYKGMTRQRTSGEGQDEYPSGSGNNNSSEGLSDNPSSSRNNNNNNNNDRHSPSSSSQRRWSESEDPWHSCPRRWFHRPSDFFGVDSFFDRFWFDNHFPFSFGLFDRHNPFFADMMGDYEASPTWPVTYLMFSPYSPLHLERQAHRDRGVFSSIMSSLRISSDRDPAEPQWREAFEDLLRLENGKPMLDRDSTAVTKKETGREWLQGLVVRGSLGDRWKYVSGGDGQPWSGITFESHDRIENDHPKSEAERVDEDQQIELSPEKESDAVTEADMYDRFLKDIENREREFFTESPLVRFLLEERRRQQERIEEYERRLPSSENTVRNDDTESWLEHVSGKDENPVQETAHDSNVDTQLTKTESQPTVVSTMTTTERVRLSDGTVETKIVKTKRFADGREETNESVEVTNPAQRSENADKNETTNKDGRKGGWFWKD